LIDPAVIRKGRFVTASSSVNAEAEDRRLLKPRAKKLR
jgi:hypothetical protein